MASLHSDFTQGSLRAHVTRFSLPFLLSNLIQAFYSVADMLVVGRYCDAAALSGVNIGGQVTNLVLMMVSGLTVGGTVLVAQYFGARQKEEVSRTIGTMFTLLGLMAVALSALVIALSGPILTLLRTPGESFSEAQAYLVICSLGNIFIFGYNAISAVQRGLGDSKRPLIFVSIACVINVVLDIILVGYVGLGAAGAAWATIAAQGISMLLAMVYLSKNRFLFDFKRSSFKIHPDKVRLLLRVGLPSSLQSVVVNLSFLLMTALTNGFGVYASAAVGIAGKFNSFAILPAVAMSSSVSSIAAQNIGAGLYDRARGALISGIQIALGLGVAVWLLVQLAPEFIMRLFSNEDEVIRLGVVYIRAFSYDYLLVPIGFCLNGLLTGAGHTTLSMISGMLSSIVLRMPAAYLLSRTELGLAGVGAAAPIASAASLIFGLCFVVSGYWRRDATGIRKNVQSEEGV